MKVVCCSCGIFLLDKPSNGAPEDAISHGLCDPCSFEFLAQAGMPLPEYLEGLPAPVVTVTPEGTISTANTRALELLGKTAFQVQGYRGGDVFQCENALLPGGCGETVHCSGCTIRRTVMDTLHTGKRHRRVEAYLNQYSGLRSRRIQLYISTEKKAGVVFLEIEHLSEVAAVP